MAVDLLAQVLSSGRADPGAPALVTPEGASWSYASLDERVSAEAERLLDEGTGAGRVAPFPMEATCDGIVHLLAVWRAGAIPAPLHPALTAFETAGARRRLEETPSLPGDAQVILWTSGTSGRPRGVALTWAGLVANADASRRRLDLCSTDLWLASLSPSHVGGLALLVRAWLLGSAVLAAGRFRADAAWSFLSGSALGSGAARPVSHASFVPTQLARLLDVAGDAPPPPSLRGVLLGGARAPFELVARAQARGWPLALTYGMTEMTSQVATSPPGARIPGPGFVGPPLPGVEVTLSVDGEILARGPTMAAGYIGEETPLCAPDGWYHTGDLGSLDRDGNLWVRGRLDDRIITGGVNVDPLEVEEVLRAHPRVSDACVVGVPDDEWGQRVAAWVVPTWEAEPPDAPTLDEFLREHLTPAKRPRLWAWETHLPRNAMGKTDRAAVVRHFAAAGGDSGPGTPPHLS
ncbi:MAG: class I adenylate-forming enzyme family protein [Gemmatimonadota bacterium]